MLMLDRPIELAGKRLRHRIVHVSITRHAGGNSDGHAVGESIV